MGHCAFLYYCAAKIEVDFTSTTHFFFNSNTHNLLYIYKVYISNNEIQENTDLFAILTSIL